MTTANIEGNLVKFKRNPWNGKEDRSIELQIPFDNDPNRFVSITAHHMQERKEFSAYMLDHLRDGNTVSCMPMSSIALMRQPVARYSKKAIEAFFEEVMQIEGIDRLVERFKQNPTA